MESWCFVKHKSSLFIFMMLLIFMVGWAQGIHIEDERKALLEIKASLLEFSNSFFFVDNLLPTWVDHGTKYCDWERIKCDTTSGYVTDLSLGNMFSIEEDGYYTTYEMKGSAGMIWPLNVSLFLHFKEIRKLDLSLNYIGNTFVSTGLERLTGLKKLENLNLSNSFIETNIFSSLSQLTSLKVLDLSYINRFQEYSPTYDISEFRIPENLEVLDLTGDGYHGTLQIQGLESVSMLRKLKILNLGYNRFNESLVSSLSALISLKSLGLQGNLIRGPFPSQVISHLTYLEKLDLSSNDLNVSPSIQDCKSLMRLERLESVSIGGNYFNKSIISCLTFLPSLNILHLSDSYEFGRSSFPMQELSSLRELKTLDLSGCGLESLAFNGTMSNLLHLHLDFNSFHSVDDIMSSIAAFPSLRFLSLESSFINEGRLFANEVPNLPYLEVLILSSNYFNGTLPMEALASFHLLEVLDLSKNYFIGSIPSTLKSLSSLKAVSFAHNNLNGSLSDHGLCELKKLNELDLKGNKFDGNLHCFNRLSSLKFFDISSNQLSGKLLPSLITDLTHLEYVDFSHNKFEGSFSFSSFSNHTKLEFVAFISDNDKFEVVTEEPIGWTPMFQLKVLVLSNCNVSVVPSFLHHQHKLKKLDMSHNSLAGNVPDWLIKNNTMLEGLDLSYNSFDGISIHRNPNTRRLDMSGNRIIGTIPKDIQKLLPYISHLNLSMNSLDGDIPSSVGDLGQLETLDLSHNKLCGEVPNRLFTNLTYLRILKLSNNSLHGEILSGNVSSTNLQSLQLDSNCFTGKIGNKNNQTSTSPWLRVLDISNNFFTSLIPDWISNMSYLSVLVVRNNMLGGQFPCGTISVSFLDISQNHFSGSIPSCLNVEQLEHLHLSANKFTGLIPNSFCNLTNALTLDISKNYLSGRIPKFIGELTNLRVLLLGKNNFSGTIPKQLCRLTNAGLIDLSSNFLSGSIPSCLQSINHPSYQALMQGSGSLTHYTLSSYIFKRVLSRYFLTRVNFLDATQEEATFTTKTQSRNYKGDLINAIQRIQGGVVNGIQDEATFTTKTQALIYKGDALNIMSGLDLSCNKLTGDIPEELGLLITIRALNLSFNLLTGTIPVNFSNLANIESLDLSSNSLTGNVPSELIKLNSLSSFNVSHNNLSGKLPDLKAQFSTFSKESYEGNPLLCGPPLENDCKDESHWNHSSNEEGNDEKWYDLDMVSFYGSCGSTWFVFMLGFVAVVHINPYWRRRWFQFVEECMYTCYYFFCDLVRKPSLFLIS